MLSQPVRYGFGVIVLVLALLLMLGLIPFTPLVVGGLILLLVVGAVG
jgi:hypothetical protein